MNKKVLDFSNVEFAYTESKADNQNVISYLGKQLHIDRRTKLKKRFVLNNVNFSVYSGEIVGVLGSNGAGKSTLLKLASGILFPTSGEIRMSGVVAPIIELGTGFSPDFTARENIELYACLLGNRRKDVKKEILPIAIWAGIEDYLDQPMRTFSTGMVSRTAFSTATSFPAELVLIDEVLSVGDASFRKKSEMRMEQVLSSGAGVLFVSHDLDSVKKLTSRVLVIHRGEIVFNGDPSKAVETYLESLEL
jgi:ABC-2 type transport system ATP-binding protein